MGNVVNRKPPAGNPSFGVFHVLLSVNTPDYPSSQWIVNPLALSSLIGNGTSSNPQVPKKYWINDPDGGNVLREMTTQEKDVVDAAELGPLKQERKALLTQNTSSYLDGRYPSDTQLQILNLRHTATVAQQAAIGEYLDWYRSVFQGLDAALSAIDLATTSAQVSAVVFDPSTFTPSDPLFELQQATTVVVPPP